MRKPSPETTESVYHRYSVAQRELSVSSFAAAILVTLVTSPAAAADDAPPSPASADAPLPPSAPPPAPPPQPDSAPAFIPPPSPAFTPALDGTARDARDANADRVVVLPTAYTHPAGTAYFSSYDIILLQGGYALTDTTQVTLTSTIPIEGLVLADVSLKSVVVQDGPVHVAAIGSVTGLWGLNVGNEVLGRVGAVAEFCFDPGCRSSASMGGTLLLGGPDTVLGAGVGVIWRAFWWMSFLAEAETLIPLTSQAGKVNGVALSPGIRFPHRTWSLDIGVARPLEVPQAPTVPFVAFTFRALP